MGWANDYVGIPWRWRGRDRRGIDCYGLVRLVYAERLSITLPERQYFSTADVGDSIQGDRPRWEPVAEPKPYDVAIVDAIQRDEQTGERMRGPYHLAIAIGGGQVLQAVQSVGVVATPTPRRVEEWVRCRV